MAEQSLERHHEAIRHAQACGTYGKDDRSPQYQHGDLAKAVKELNSLWAEFRVCKRELIEKAAEIEKLKQRVRWYRVKNIALTAIITGLAWEGVKALVLWAAR